MNQLASVLRRYSRLQMGETLGQDAASPVDTDALRRDLHSVVEKSEKFLWVWLITLIAMFGLDCLAFFRDMANPKLMGAILAATGVGFAAVLGQMRRLWHEKFMTETLLSLLPALGPAEIKNVVMQLLSTLGKK
jgi:hypothetical protein